MESPRVFEDMVFVKMDIDDFSSSATNKEIKELSCGDVVGYYTSDWDEYPEFITLLALLEVNEEEGFFTFIAKK